MIQDVSESNDLVSSMHCRGAVIVLLVSFSSWFDGAPERVMSSRYPFIETLNSWSLSRCPCEQLRH